MLPSHMGAALLVSLSLCLLNIYTSHGQSPQPQTRAAPDASDSDSSQSCDCAKRVGLCKATVTFKNGELNVRSNSRRCSLVVYQVNGEPRTSIVVDGTAREQWLGDDISRLIVSRCE